MEILNSYAFRMWATQFLIVLFLVGGLFVFAVGTGLIVANERMQRVFGVMNRWVSTRRALRQMEVVHDTAPIVLRYSRWFAAFFVVGACYSIVGLSGSFNERAMISMLNMNTWPRNYAEWWVESARWFLLLGNAVAIVVGIMLAFFPGRLAVLEAKGGHWVSDRKVAKGADAIRDPLGKLVAAYPKPAGWIIAVVGVLMVGDFAIMWSRLG